MLVIGQQIFHDSNSKVKGDDKLMPTFAPEFRKI